MVKRKTLTAPSSADLARMEDEFRRETPRGPLAAPISPPRLQNPCDEDMIA